MAVMAIVCKICNALDDPEKYADGCKTREIMEKEQLCFHCAFWKKQLTNRTKDTFIVNGEHYIGHFIPNRNELNNKFLGMGGADYYVKYNDGRVAHYNDTWHQGTVPDWPEFADNAVLITREEYNKLIQEQP